jgi:hypothetical protein
LLSAVRAPSFLLHQFLTSGQREQIALPSLAATLFQSFGNLPFSTISATSPTRRSNK